MIGCAYRRSGLRSNSGCPAGRMRQPPRVSHRVGGLPLDEDPATCQAALAMQLWTANWNGELVADSTLRGNELCQ
eukprot:354212-Chlamydomonas_euryale.AAC.15